VLARVGAACSAVVVLGLYELAEGAVAEAVLELAETFEWRVRGLRRGGARRLLFGVGQFRLLLVFEFHFAPPC
jgi:hypothetical protein